MCVVSMVMETYTDRWNRQRILGPSTQPEILSPPVAPMISPKEVEEFRDLLERAREYDKRRGEPNCELDEKRQALKKIAQELGVEIDFV